MSITGVASTVGRYVDRGANFLFGTGSTTIGNKVRQAVKVRKRTGDSFVRSVANGFAQGVKKENAQLAKIGFFKKTWTTLKSIPGEMGAGFKNGKGLDDNKNENNKDKTFNININGTLKLTGDNGQSVDIIELIKKDKTLLTSLSSMISNEIKRMGHGSDVSREF